MSFPLSQWQQHLFLGLQPPPPPITLLLSSLISCMEGALWRTQLMHVGQEETEEPFLLGITSMDTLYFEEKKKSLR